MKLKDAAAQLRRLMGELGRIANDLDPEVVTPPPKVNTSLALNSSQIYVEEMAKDLIVLHFTAGSNASGAVAHWKSKKERVGTAYIVERSGEIFQVFDPRYWAWHLSINSTQGAAHDKRSIGIELVNVGPLKRRGGHFCWWPPNDYQLAWCSEEEGRLYAESSWKGMDAFATFTDEQYAALNSLIPWLREKFNIPARVLTFEAGVEEAVQFSGLASHHNFTDKKFDIGPAFDWGKLL